MPIDILRKKILRAKLSVLHNYTSMVLVRTMVVEKGWSRANLSKLICFYFAFIFFSLKISESQSFSSNFQENRSVLIFLNVLKF